jgi:hypothetical protein
LTLHAGAAPSRPTYHRPIVTQDRLPVPKAASATKAKKDKSASGANLGFEAKLWLTADKLRNNWDAASYADCCTSELGLIH